MNIGFTGTRDGMTEKQYVRFAHEIARVAYYYDSGISGFHHGDCLGADAQAHDLLVMAGGKNIIFIHPPDDESQRAFCDTEGIADIYDPLPYLERDTEIVKASYFLFVAPKEMTERVRSGTWTTKRIAERLGVGYGVVFPDGSYREP